VLCNQRIKFADLLHTARDLGAAALATGHYVRRHEGAGGPELWRGAEVERDQSYFLFATRPDELDFLRFPLGGMPKAETRALARRLGLGVAEKADSQDICFVPDGRYADVVARLQPQAAQAGDSHVAPPGAAGGDAWVRTGEGFLVEAEGAEGGGSPAEAAGAEGSAGGSDELVGAARQRRLQHAQPVGQPPEPWQALTTEEGHVYYYNAITGVSSWTLEM
jgi:hypothetical protein